jgi:hypothetical protein
VSRTHVVIGFELVTLGLRQRQSDLFSHCVFKNVVTRPQTCVRKELPFAGYSVVKEPERNLVENTGLEPVTSWLQTRRSPS